MAEVILIIVEGEEREGDVMLSFDNAGLFPKPTKKIVYAGEIYQLYKKLENDNGLDLIGLLQEEGKLDINDSREKFSEIYLFFDYDPHSQIYRDENGKSHIHREMINSRIEKMLARFNNETEDGMLFLSYPMVEAVRICECFSKDLDSFLGCHIDYQDVKRFKQHISEHSLCKSFDFSNIKEEDCKKIIEWHLIKVNYLIHHLKDMPEEVIEQSKIFSFYKCHQKIYILSAFPLMLQHYYGPAKMLEMLSS